MGTRCEIYVRDGDGEEVIQLWKHWDGYEEYMIPFFKDFVRWMNKLVQDNYHWLTYPPDVAGSLIAYDYENKRKEIERITKAGEDTKCHTARPDVRPKGEIMDAEYVWILNTAPINSKPYFRLVGYMLGDYNGLSEEEIKAVKEGKELDRIKVCDEELEL